MPRSLDIAKLAAFVERGVGVAPQYRHVPKHVVAGDAVQFNTALLKWYEIHPVSLPVPASVRALARSAVQSDRLPVDGLGFVLLHRCEQDFYFLIVCAWRNENELWESVWHKNGAAMVEFTEFGRDPAHLPTYCVWELATVWHEQQSWVRFLDSPRDASSVQQWCEATYRGPC